MQLDYREQPLFIFKLLLRLLSLAKGIEALAHKKHSKREVMQEKRLTWEYGVLKGSHKLNYVLPVLGFSPLCTKKKS